MGLIHMKTLSCVIVMANNRLFKVVGLFAQWSGSDNTVNQEE